MPFDKYNYFGHSLILFYKKQNQTNRADFFVEVLPCRFLWIGGLIM